MNQYKSGKWMGDVQPRHSVRPAKTKKRCGDNRPAVAGLMFAVGFALTVIIGELPPAKGTLALSVSASGYNEAYAPLLSEEETTSGAETPLIYPETLLFTDMNGADGSGEDFDASSYTSSLTGEQVSKKLKEIESSNKFAADNAYRRYNAGAVVSSSNRNLYLNGYSYRSSQSLNGTYVGLNSRGIPMSEYNVPSYVNIGANNVPTEYSYYIDGTATAYYTTGRTATGTYTYQGSVAVDPREIPYGTEMWITSSDGRYVYGYCRAEDTGGFIYYSNGATVDLYMHSRSDCIQWGKRGVRIYILSK